MLFKFASRVEKKLLRIIRRLVYGNILPEKNLNNLDGDALNNFISSSIIADQPFMVARFGSIELSASLFPYIVSLPLLERYKFYVQGKIDYIRSTEEYKQFLMEPLCNNAGFFPKDTTLLERYSELVTNDVRELDCCCCNWEREDLMEKFFSNTVVFAYLNDLEPYDYAIPWSQALDRKKVLVVHPFAGTIESQYSKRKLLWEDKNVLPDFDLKTIKAVQSIAGEKVPFDTWFDALDYMKSEMDKIDYDVAIIGCGAYGFHLAAHAKRQGKKAIHLGGATQILFGIKGKRWDNLPAVSKFYNENWVYPSIDETPRNNNRVENGCYW